MLRYMMTGYWGDTINTISQGTLIAKQFSWRQHIADGMLEDILRADSIYYTHWYENIFKDGFKTSSGYDISLSLDKWHSLMGVGPK